MFSLLFGNSCIEDAMAVDCRRIVFMYDFYCQTCVLHLCVHYVSIASLLLFLGRLGVYVLIL